MDTATSLSESVSSPEETTEVVVTWGDDTVLCVEHVPNGHGFTVGDAADAHGHVTTDYVIGRESLGYERLPIVVSMARGAAVVLAKGASGELAIGDAGYVALAGHPSALPWDGLAGAFAYPLGPTARVRVRLGAFTFFITRTPRDRPLDRTPLRPSIRESACFLGVAAAHLAVLLLFQLVPPHAAALSLERLDDRTRYLSIELARALPPQAPQTAVGSTSPSQPKGSAAPSDADAAPAPRPDRPPPHKRASAPSRGDAPNLPQRPSAAEARSGVGILGTLHAYAQQLGRATSRFGRDAALGDDAEAALRDLLVDGIAGSGSWGTIGMRGPGRGSGGDASGGANVGRIGPQLGFTGGPSYGAELPLRRAPKLTVPTLRPGRADVRGSLSREAIQRVIRRELPAIRYCYEQGLLARPDLEGRVTLKFVISGAGLVQTAVVAQSSLGDARVEVCIAQAAKLWSFTPPEGGGIVIVTYPFTFQRPGS